MSATIGDPPLPLQTITLPSYLYAQYADDDTLQAFVSAYNLIAQSYLDWANQTPFGVYTNANVTGQLLDFIAQGIYGIPRPVFSTLASHFESDAVDEQPIDTMAINSSSHSQSGTAIIANDDFYKRTMTWLTYIGDGRVPNIMVIRKRIARFLYGVNGSDITLTQAQAVDIAVVTGPPIHFLITIPAGAGIAANYFQEAFQAGTLTFPFQFAATVAIV